MEPRTTASSSWPKPIPALNHTLHLKDPVTPDETYRVEAMLSVGLSKDAQMVDRQTFDLTLTFRDPDAGEPGYGFNCSP